MKPHPLSLYLRRAWRPFLLLLGVAVLYYATARLGLVLQLPRTNASPVWPPSGVGLAAMLLFGLRVWPSITLGAFLANLMTLPQTLEGFWASAAICLGNTLEVVVAWWLLRRLIPSLSLFERSRDVLWFTVTVGIGCAVASTTGATAVWLAGIIPSEIVTRVWVTWWLGDTVGMLVLAPALYCLWREPWLGLSVARAWELVALMALALLTVELFFGRWVESPITASLPYVAIVPSLLWAAFRFGPREASALTVLVSASIIGHTWKSLNWLTGQEAIASGIIAPFMNPAFTPNDSLLILQVFLGALGITALSLAAAVAERNRFHQELQAVNLTLEQRVTDRTADLAQANQNLSLEIVERQHVQEELQRYSTALERSNQELDDFAYIASHDLKEPVRGINNYALFLREDHASQLDPEAQSKIQTIQRLTRHMEDLIESLLYYSRVGRAELSVQETDQNVILRDIIDSLHVSLQERGVEVRIPQTLPTIRCDRVRVGEVFRNLITNAMKYNDKAEKWIEIGFDQSVPGKEGQTETVFHVRDNGIGILDKHRQAVFRIFKRLHGRTEFGGGTGAGLTIVKKIIERHGGRIWIESTVGQGSTFFFTLPQG